MVTDAPLPTIWSTLEKALDATAYTPKRREDIICTRLENHNGPYYILKQPETKSYLRLSEQDFALWWQMDGTRTVKDLLLYNLKRYRTLPIGRLTGFVADLRAGHFLQDNPVNIYDQVTEALARRAPASRGRRLLNGFLHTEIALQGLDDPFVWLYEQLRWLFTWQAQLILLGLILLGGFLFGRLVWLQLFALSANGAYSVVSLIGANLLIIAIHELAHGLTTKYYRRELNRGGFLLYWGMPAFFVDTRDIWLSPRPARVAVSWAGPHSGLMVGGAMGLACTAVALYAPDQINTLWAGFLYQLGFLAFLSVLINLNPLLELDGYFILMDSLDIPNLRQRAINFWRTTLLLRWQTYKTPTLLWQNLDRHERLFAAYGALTLIYSTYALWLAVYFWQTRLIPFIQTLWRDYGLWGQGVVLLLTAVLILPALFYLGQYSWSRIRAGLEWLSRRDLLSRTDVLALLVGLPVLIGLPLGLFGLTRLPAADIWLHLAEWLIHLTAVATFIGIARQLPGSRFQWVIWCLSGAPIGITLAWIIPPSPWRIIGLLLAAGSILAAGVIAGFTVWPRTLELKDRLLMGTMFLLGLGYVTITYLFYQSGWFRLSFILFSIFPGLIFMTPLIINFLSSRFALPWGLLLLAILTLPWLHIFPTLHLPVILLWLYAGLLYLLLGSLAQFARHEIEGSEIGAYSERERLVSAFNHFMQAMFTSYEAIFGGRRLGVIQAQMLSLGPIDPDTVIPDIAARCREALLLAIDRLDDLAGTPFTRQAGQAAYDSLPWLEAETLARHVLSLVEWGSHLAQGFIVSRDQRAQLIRQADIFAGFDQEDINEVLGILQSYTCRAGVQIADENEEATRFFLVQSGEVGVFHQGTQIASLTAGGYFGTMALLDNGTYMATYRALSPITALVIERQLFDPILRVDTTLSSQVSSGARERQLLRQMPLFSTLSPQQLATVDARLLRRRVTAGELIASQGQARSYLFIVASGLVEVLVGEKEGTAVLGELGPAEHFGEYALFADTPYQHTYRARYDTELLLLDEAEFDKLVAGCAEMSRYVEQIGSGRLFATRRRLGLSGLIS